MTMEGIWTGEFHESYGWEESGVYVLEHGHIMGGNHRHYSKGTYSVSGTTYAAEIDVHYYGPLRTVFGEKRQQFRILVNGEIRDDVILAKVERPDRPQFSIEYRMTRRMELPNTSPAAWVRPRWPENTACGEAAVKPLSDPYASCRAAARLEHSEVVT